MSKKLGAQLRRRREQRGISLETIARQTKIKRSLLEALERDDVSGWPGGLFRRAFVRAYAQAIGLDPESTVRDFLASFPDQPPTQLQTAHVAAASPAPPSVLSPGPDLDVVARLCTELGRLEETDAVQPWLEEAARILEAKGLIVWVWNELAEALKPALVHGYPHQAVARLPVVRRDSDNLTADAFRAAQRCTINGDGETSGALVVPMLAPVGCIGVLAIEFEPGVEQTTAVAAVATIVAALLSQLISGQTVAAEARSRESA